MSKICHRRIMIFHLCMCKFVFVVEIFFQASKTLVIYAIEKDSKDALEVLVAAGVDVNLADKVLYIKFMCLTPFIIA